MAFNRQTHCKKGHELTHANTRWALKENGERRRVCRLCNNEYHRKRSETARNLGDEKMRQQWRKSKLKTKYGITEEQWDAQYDLQDGHCFGCEISFEIMIPCVDHDHTTGLFRGLLCHPCNRAIGLLKENCDTLQRLAGYLTSGAGDRISGPLNTDALSSQSYVEVPQENPPMDSRTPASIDASGCCVESSSSERQPR